MVYIVEIVVKWVTMLGVADNRTIQTRRFGRKKGFERQSQTMKLGLAILTNY
jgi:hypothetical protein